MESNRQNALREAIALTDEILLVLEDQNFSRVVELDTRRQPLIRQAFEKSLEQIDDIKVRHLQNLNQQVVSKLDEFKNAVLQKQHKLRHANRAANAYQSFQP